MARFIYGTNDISASTFPSWSNAIDEGASNISQSTAFSDFHPSQGPADFGIQILQGASVFYGNVVPGNGVIMLYITKSGFKRILYSIVSSTSCRVRSTGVPIIK